MDKYNILIVLEYGEDLVSKLRNSVILDNPSFNQYFQIEQSIEQGLNIAGQPNSHKMDISINGKTIRCQGSDFSQNSLTEIIENINLIQNSYENRSNNTDLLYKGCLIQKIHQNTTLREDEINKYRFHKTKRIGFVYNYEDEANLNYNINYTFDLEQSALQVQYDINTRYHSNRNFDLQVLVNKVIKGTNDLPEIKDLVSN